MKRYSLEREMIVFLIIPLVVAVFILAILGGCPWPGPEPELGTLAVDTEPVKGEVFVNGESWGIAPQSQKVEAAAYVVTFGAMAGYRTPDRQQVKVPEGGEKVVSGVYVKGDPPPVQKLRVLIVYETDHLDNMLPNVASIFASKPLRDWLAVNCESEDGQPAFRFLDKDNDVSRLSQWWQGEFAKAKAQPLPVLIIVAPTKRFEGPLPADAQATLKLLVQYAEGE